MAYEKYRCIRINIHRHTRNTDAYEKYKYDMTAIIIIFFYLFVGKLNLTLRFITADMWMQSD